MDLIAANAHQTIIKGDCIVNQFIQFNGRDQLISLGDFSNKRGLMVDCFTIEAWVKETASQEWAGIVGLTNGDVGHEQGWSLAVTFDRRFTFSVATGDSRDRRQLIPTSLKAHKRYALNQWHHIAGVFDGKSLTLYVNGVLENSMTIANQSGLVQWPLDGELLIGAFAHHNGVAPFSGGLAEVRLWGGVRRADEILDNKDIRLDPALQTHLLGYWPLCDGADDGAGKTGAGRTFEDWTKGKNGILKGADPVWQDETALILGGYYPMLPPELNLPCEVDSRSFALSWQAADKAEFYLLDVAEDGAFSHCLKGFDGKKIIGTSVRVPRLAEETTYYYRLRSANSRLRGNKTTDGNIRTAERTLPKAGYALAVDHNTEVLQVDYQQQLFHCLDGDITVEIWVKTNTLQNQASYIGISSDTAGSYGWWLGCEGGCYQFNMMGSHSAISVRSPIAIVQNKWVHLAGIFSTSQLRLLVNGEQVAVSCGALSGISVYPADGQLLIGGEASGGNGVAAKVSLADIRVYSSALDNATIKAKMKQRLDPGEHQTLQAYWRCDRGEGDAVKDIAGGYHARPLVGTDKPVWQAAVLPLTYPLRQISQVVVGANHQLALDDNGLVWAWGDNDYGQLGDGSGVSQARPVLVKTSDDQYLADIQQIAVGQDFSLALSASGQVYAWGANDYGELGCGNRTVQQRPTLVAALTSISQIAAEGFHGLALTSTGELLAWGRNQYGQLGDGTTTDRLSPVSVSGLTDITAMAAGQNHAVALNTTGVVYCWGYNNKGQLGNNSNSTSTTAVKVADNAQSVSAGGNNTVILDGDRKLMAWGELINSVIAKPVLDGSGKPQVWRWKTINPAALILPGRTLNIYRSAGVEIHNRAFDRVKDKFGMVRFNPDSNQISTSDASIWSVCQSDIPDKPAAINGSTNLFPGMTGCVYSVAAMSGVSGYRWSVPSGTTLTTGGSGVSIGLTCNTSGELGVVAFNDQGESRERKIYLDVSAQTQTFNYSGRIESFTVPAGVTYLRIEAWGAQGGNSGGRGARIRGDVTVTPGEVLRILVGGQGTAKHSYQSGGGGGSFVVRQNNNPLIIAGGGGGQSHSYTSSYMHGTTARNASRSYGSYYGARCGVGGADGSGGKASSTSSGGGGGGGLYSNGGTGYNGSIARSFTNGGQGGSAGGFGGGGSIGYWGAGGGGGYSGGGGTYSYQSIGGGGGSYNAGSQQSQSSGARSGHGLITIQY